MAENEAGNAYFWKDGSRALDVTISHTSSTATIRVGSNFDSSPTDEAWGIQNVKLWAYTEWSPPPPPPPVTSCGYRVESAGAEAVPESNVARFYIDGVQYTFAEIGRGFNFMIVDRVVVPHHLPAGEYVLSFRYDAEQTPQVWANCADLRITESAVEVEAA